jgi:hypothetical protein
VGRPENLPFPAFLLLVIENIPGLADSTDESSIEQKPAGSNAQNISIETIFTERKAGAGFMKPPCVQSGNG